jgi:hypothetical protein
LKSPLGKKINTLYRKVSSFLVENGIKANLILFLGLLAYVIIGVDFDTEYAVQQDEISYVIGVLNRSLNDAGLDILTIIDLKPPLIGLIITIDDVIVVSSTIEFPTDRAPPTI